MLNALRKVNSASNSCHSLSDLPFTNFEAISNDHPTEVMLQEMIETTQAQIDQINEELKRITESASGTANHNLNKSSVSSVESSCSLFVDNNLYPKFNYFVDTRKLVAAIQEIEVKIGSTDIINPKTYFLGNNSDAVSDPDQLEYYRNSSFFGSVMSGINNDGSFLLQLNFNDTTEDNNVNSNIKINMFIEEISKYIRQKRIGDSEWKSFAELHRMPQIHEKCFCLEPKTRKWLRARVVLVDSEAKLCKVNFLDTGFNQVESNGFRFDSMLVWRDFDLARYPARTIKCVLEKSGRPGEFINNVCLETKFYFKDTLANRSFKCELVEPVKDLECQDVPSDLNTWIVRLNKIEGQQENVNELVEVFNNHEILVLENKAVDKN